MPAAVRPQETALSDTRARGGGDDGGGARRLETRGRECVNAHTANEYLKLGFVCRRLGGAALMAVWQFSRTYEAMTARFLPFFAFPAQSGPLWGLVEI